MHREVVEIGIGSRYPMDHVTCLRGSPHNLNSDRPVDWQTKCIIKVLKLTRKSSEQDASRYEGESNWPKRRVNDSTECGVVEYGEWRRNEVSNGTQQLHFRRVPTVGWMGVGCGVWRVADVNDDSHYCRSSIVDCRLSIIDRQ